MDKVSVVIPTYNRFKCLMNTIKSIKNQTYRNIEIIVINDCSTDEEYYNYDWNNNNIKIIHLEINSKNIFGCCCPGYIRNHGIKNSTGKYIAFCDDDDIWFPKKIQLQLAAMYETDCKMCSTDGITGEGIYDDTKKYLKYNGEKNYYTLQKIYKSRGSSLLENGFPKIWDLDFIKIHNCIITSSVIIEKDILTKIGNFKYLSIGREDGECWLRALEHTNSVYIEDICFYYDCNHGK